MPNDVSIEGIGKVDPSGSQTVTPQASTTYRLTAKGPGGTQDATAPSDSGSGARAGGFSD